MGDSTIVLDRRLFAYIPAIGFLTVAIVGIAGCFALVCCVLWLVAQLLLLIVQSLTECFSLLGETFQTADPFTRLLILICFSLAGYWIARRKYHHARI